MESLELPCAAVSQYYSTKTTVSLVQGMLQMHERAGTDRAEELLDVVRFTEEDVSGRFASVTAKAGESYTRAFKSMLGKALNLPGKTVRM